MQLAADKQRAAATVIDIASNKFALYGVAGLEIYGLLNDPNLPAAVTPLPNADRKTLWAEKSTKEIYEDVLYLFGKMADRGAGHIDANTELVLATSPATQVQLGKATDFNISARQMLETYFPKSVSLHCLNWLPQLAALPFCLSLRQSKDCRPLKSDLAKNSVLCA